MLFVDPELVRVGLEVFMGLNHYKTQGSFLFIFKEHYLPVFPGAV